MTGREIPRHPGERHQDPALRAYDQRPDKLRRTGREASGQRTRGGFASPALPSKIILFGGLGGLYQIQPEHRSLTRAIGAICAARASHTITTSARDAPGPGTRERSRNHAADRRARSGPRFSKKNFMRKPAEPANKTAGFQVAGNGRGRRP